MKLIYKKPTKSILALAEFHGFSLTNTFNKSKVIETELETPHNFFSILYLPIFNLEYSVKNNIKVNLKLFKNTILISLKSIFVLNEIILLNGQTLASLMERLSKSIVIANGTKTFEFTYEDYINFYVILVHVQENTNYCTQIQFFNYLPFLETKIELPILQKYTINKFILKNYAQLVQKMGYFKKCDNIFIIPLYKRNIHTVYADLIYYTKTVLTTVPTRY